MTTGLRAGYKSTVPVYILAGGRSRRFGSNKARAIHRGVPLLVSVARELEPAACSITVVGSRGGEYDDLGLRTIGDVRPGLGPLGGLVTAFGDAAPGWLLLTACDWIGLRREWVTPLLVAARAKDSGVVVYRAERYEPLFALYHSSLADLVGELLETEDRSMHALISRADVTTLPVPPDWRSVRNLNRPAKK